jgi:hypothetical protein
MTAVAATAADAPLVAPIDDRDAMEKIFAEPFILKRSGWYAAYGSLPGGSTRIAYNLGHPISLRFDGGRVFFSIADIAGKKVKKGDSITVRTLGFRGTTPDENSAERYQKMAAYLGLANGERGYKVDVKRGRLLPVTDGLLDVEAEDGVADFSIPNPRCGLKMVLPARVYGLNDRWSAVLYDHGLGKARPIGTTYDGVGYIRLDPEYADVTHVAVGHPIVVSDPRVFVNFVQTEENPNAYHLLLNNPTDETLQVKVRQTMNLPGLDFGTRVVELAPGSRWTTDLTGAR